MPNLQTIRNLKDGKNQCIVTYGTSLTDGAAWVEDLNAQLAEHYPGLATVINSAKAAMWSQWGMDNLSEKVLAHKPDMVFIEFAINDAYLPYETTLEQCRSRLEAMIDSILEINPWCDIVLMTMNPPVGGSLDVRPIFNDYYDVYRSVAKERQLSLIDHFAAWHSILNEDPDQFHRWVPDSIHPIAEGSLAVTAKGVQHLLFNGN
ncbi:SGNH/GDSL hydrolase family protein [Paenibacillus aceris]|uniref:Lysophospholipase L1-like esterase n=1 Tax=Paenibacillus aceris TaxID=869555 RepID=A0ABS4I3A5_9BACL|nr:SGNH/GDSL hydrolase family protein [Paenibacillus aceris]MBP1964911.1 lysophospholipase L1-like esterase [Paenibacillus aceris]NHW38157.1 SGNH/GDSL hydrolase family protein [Paenibacillus aceris]